MKHFTHLRSKTTLGKEKKKENNLNKCRHNLVLTYFLMLSYKYQNKGDSVTDK